MLHIDGATTRELLERTAEWDRGGSPGTYQFADEPNPGRRTA